MRKISEGQLLYLLRRARKLTLLEDSGVDNWEWYGEALSNEDDDKDKQEQLDFVFGDADPEINNEYMKKYEKLD